MRKISEIKRDLSAAIEKYKNSSGEAKEAALAEVRALTAELEEVQEVERAERAAAMERMSEQERNELQRFSFVKFLREAADGNVTGFENEMLQEGRREAAGLGITLKGYGIPYVVLSGKRAAKGQNAGTEADGGYLGVTNGPTYIEALRDSLAVQQLGAQFMTGLVGTLTFAKGNTVDIAWAGEAEEVENKKIAYTLEEMKQRRLVVTTAFTKDLLNQTSLDVENMIMNEMIQAHAQGLDKAALNGSSTKEPKGILNITGIGQVVMGENGDAINWAKVVELETAIAAKNAAIGNLAYLTNAKVVGALKTTEKSTGTARYLMEIPGQLNGYRCAMTNLMPSTLKKGSSGNELSSMIFGNWSDLIVGQWGGLDIIVDPYTLKKSAQVEITLNAWHDVYVRHNESFAAIKDIKTA